MAEQEVIAKEAGLSPQLAAKMRNSPEGLEANVQVFRTNGEAFERRFAEAGISPELLNAAIAQLPDDVLDVIREKVGKSGGLSAKRLLDELEDRGFTLKQQTIVNEVIDRLLRRKD